MKTRLLCVFSFVLVFAAAWGTERRALNARRLPRS
jgi:hypothetical protein